MVNPKKLKSTSSGQSLLDKLSTAVEEVVAQLAGGVAGSTRAQRARGRLEEIARTLASASEKLDSTRRPASVFDPSNPALVGRFIALTMIAQDRVPLSTLEKFYGAGVYAIYYVGPFATYRAISKKEHPIYVGKADPTDDKATNAMQQGTKLWARLNEHKKSISKAPSLDLNDFECRFLVVASGWQKAAEEYLIRLFRPIWNNEINLVFGIGKHGDAAETRGNKRSPWDTLHPGRAWAADGRLKDQKSVAQIEKELAIHFSGASPYKSQQDIFARFMAEMRQLPTISKAGDKSAK